MENTYKIKILTPTHIGSENEPLKEGLDYFSHKGQTHFINWKKVFADDVLSYELEKEIISGYLSDNLRRKLIEKKLTAVKHNLSLKGDVREHITNQFTSNPIIPGSSIKGAIRSVLLNWLMEKTGEKLIAREKFKDEKQEFRLQKKFFGVSSDGSDFMRFFQVSDVEFETEPDYIASKVLSLDGNSISKWKHSQGFKDKKFKKEGFTTNYQIIPLNSISEHLKISWEKEKWEKERKKNRKDQNDKKDRFSLFVDKIESEIKNLHKRNNRSPRDERKLRELKNIHNIYMLLNEFSIPKLFQIINDHTIAYADKEIEFHNKYNQAQYSDKLVEAWQEIKKLAQQAHEAGNKYAILRLGQGSGFHSITGDWQFDDHLIEEFKGRYAEKNGKKIPKTRKWAFRANGNNPEFFPMGFVAIGDVPEDLMFESQIPDKKSQPTDEPKPQPESQKPYEPTWKSLKNLKQGDIIDAEVTGFEKPYILCKVFVEEIKDKIFKVKYNAGKEPGTMLQLKVNNFIGRGENRRLPEILNFYKVINHGQ